jgi:diadenylate cyclase
MNDILTGIMTYLRRVEGYDRLVTAVQLLLIGVVVYLVMRSLRGTRGARLVKGAGLLLAAVYLTVRLLPKSEEWKRIEFLYGNFLFFAFVAAVVAFQPELRRALTQIGQAKLFRSPRRRVEDLIEGLLESVSYLARNKMGALIAVERGVGLGTWIESGTPLDAEVTSQILNTIFYPGSALHDMGVIIRNGRLSAAGCQFPLAESEEVDPTLGSRHRAALGLAQDSDAAIIVVSEETGRVSLACEGHLNLGLDQEKLRAMLLQLLTERSTFHGRRRRRDHD